MLLALPAGALAAPAFAPYHLIPLLVPAFAGLLWLLTPGGWRARSAVGWAFGFGYFLAGLFWIGEAFLVDAARYGWLRPFAIALVSAGLALFPAMAAVLAGIGRGPLSRWLALAGAWMLLEWLRGWVLTGFPWNQAGDAWIGWLPLAQAAALVGVLGLTLVTVLAASAPALFATAGWRAALAANLAMLALLGAGHVWGTGRLAALPPPDTDVRLRVVQPNVPQHLKWRPDLRAGHLATLSRLSAGDPVDLVIWPETATPLLLERDDEVRRALAAALPDGAVLLTGSPRLVEAGGAESFRNSLHAVAASGRVIASYDKHHLVPFGEYLPWRSVLSRLGLGKLVAGRGDFGPGPGQVVLNLPDVPPVQPLICYEVIFATEVGGAGRPGWLLNVTNDAWFGTGAGPRQHLAIARLRAIEQGVPLVRAANTGISAIVDASGRVRQALALNSGGAIDAVLPGALPLAPPFARHGHWPALAAAIALLGLAALRRPARIAN